MATVSKAKISSSAVVFVFPTVFGFPKGSLNKDLRLAVLNLHSSLLPRSPISWSQGVREGKHLYSPWGALPGRPHQAMLPCSPNSGPLAFTQGPLQRRPGHGQPSEIKRHAFDIQAIKTPPIPLALPRCSLSKPQWMFHWAETTYRHFKCVSGHLTSFQGESLLYAFCPLHCEIHFSY